MIIVRLLSAVAIVAILAGASVVAWWVVETRPQPQKDGKAATPSVLVHKVAEAEMGLIRLSEEAEDHLGPETAPVEMQSVRRVRTYGGEVTVPAGRTITVSAPLGGMLRGPTTGVPLAGSLVTKGQSIFLLLPLLSPEASTTFAAAKVDAEGQVHTAKTQLEMTKLAWNRADRLLKGEAGSKRAVEEAQAQYDTAQRTLEAAESRLAILTKAVGDAATGRASPIQIEAPEPGILRSVLALADQNVPGGAILFEVVDLGQVWIRVPIYVGDLDTIDRDEAVRVGSLSGRISGEMSEALPVAAPPSANPQAATVDLYYALENRRIELTPGQRVGVTIPLAGNHEVLAVPWGAIVYDIQGEAWVYQRTAPRTYKRVRVVLQYVVNGVAALATGPAVGAEIVTAGAQELLGAETGFSK